MNKRINILTSTVLLISCIIISISSCKKEKLEAKVIKLVSGDNQSAVHGNLLTEPVEVIIMDQNGNVLPDAIVYFEVTGGSVSATTVISDANGKASVTWTLGAEIGDQILKISIQNGSYRLVFANATGEASKIEILSGVGQAANIEATLMSPIVIIVKDQYGNGILGRTVNFATVDGSLSTKTAITDIDGKAETTWTLGSTIGFQSITVTTFEDDEITHLINSPLKVFAKTGELSVTDFDGNNYNVVFIGNQVWMKENLKVTHYEDGTAIPHITDNTEWGNLGDNSTDKAYCYYNNNANNEADTYGALYTYAAAVNGVDTTSAKPSGVQGACPAGWHVPSEAEWTELVDYLGDYTIAGGKLKEKGTTHWRSPNVGATNSTGFSALPGGYRYYNYSTTLLGNEGFWWSATANSRTISHHMAYAWISGGKKSMGYSVRCVMD